MIDLSDNVNLWGPPPSAARALRMLDPLALARYPGADGGRLRAVLAAFLGVDEAALILGCGSDELIDLAFRYAGPAATLTYDEPNFSMIPVFARANRLRVAPDGDVLYISTPNNPTGALVSEPEIRAALARRHRLVILDGAYAEYADGPGWYAQALAADNVLVLRTFSKAWGLAGLRIGYAIGAPTLIAQLHALRSPYSVNTVAETAAIAALEHDAGWVRERSLEAIAIRARLTNALRETGWAPLDSRANFVLVPVTDARAESARLRARGVVVRAFERLPGIGDAIRIGIGPWPVMQHFLDAFAAERSCG